MELERRTAELSTASPVGFPRMLLLDAPNSGSQNSTQQRIVWNRSAKG